MMITWFESVISPINKGKSRALSKLKHKIIPKVYNENDIELASKIFILQYKIRDAYLHNGQEIRFDDNLFYKFHYLAVILLKKIIELSFEINTHHELIEYFEQN